MNIESMLQLGTDKPFVIPEITDSLNLDLKIISEMFRNRLLLERESFFVLDKNTKEVDSSIYLADYKLEAKALLEKFKDKNVIVVKNLEAYNKEIENICNKLSSNTKYHTNLHMYLTPGYGESFKTHKDDRHIYIKMLYGEKIIVCKESGVDKSYHLKKNNWMHIPFGLEHRAVNCGPAISLSFGVVESDIAIFDFGITEFDLQQEFGDL